MKTHGILIAALFAATLTLSVQGSALADGVQEPEPKVDVGDSADDGGSVVDGQDGGDVAVDDGTGEDGSDDDGTGEDGSGDGAYDETVDITIFTFGYVHRDDDAGGAVLTGVEAQSGVGLSATPPSHDSGVDDAACVAVGTNGKPLVCN